MIGHLLAFEDQTIPTNNLVQIMRKFGLRDYLRKNGFTETIPKRTMLKLKMAYKYPNYINKLSKASYNTL